MGQEWNKVDQMREDDKKTRPSGWRRTKERSTIRTETMMSTGGSKKKTRGVWRSHGQGHRTRGPTSRWTHPLPCTFRVCSGPGIVTSCERTRQKEIQPRRRRSPERSRMSGEVGRWMTTLTRSNGDGRGVMKSQPWRARSRK